MSVLADHYQQLLEQQAAAEVHMRTLGTWHVDVHGVELSSKAWGRDKTVQLLQFLITNRDQHGLHKESIVNRLWEDASQSGGDRDFKVAMHGINKALEPDRPPRTDPKYVVRNGIAYQLDQQLVWIDATAFSQYIALGHEARVGHREIAIACYRAALALYQGTYLPNRVFEDWTSMERERLQVLALGGYMSLAQLVLEDNPHETVMLTQDAIKIDPSWEDAYQLQMKAYLATGNRPAAIKTYHNCIKILDEEYGLDPLPETQEVFDEIDKM